MVNGPESKDENDGISNDVSDGHDVVSASLLTRSVDDEHAGAAAVFYVDDCPVYKAQGV